MKKDKIGQSYISQRTGKTQEGSLSSQEENLQDESQYMETEVRTDNKTTKRRQPNSIPNSPNGNRMAPPTKKLLENGKDQTNNRLLTSSNDSKLDFSRIDISPDRDMDTDQA